MKRICILIILFNTLSFSSVGALNYLEGNGAASGTIIILIFLIIGFIISLVKEK